jgi:hypothetical protein
MAAAMEGKAGLLEKLAAFARCVENSSLYMVLAIDSTISALEEVDQIARALTLSCESITHEISMNPVLAGCLLDPAGKVVEALSAARQRMEDLLPGLIAQSSALAQTAFPDQDQCDFLSFAFERSIESCGWILGAVMKLGQVIVTHDQTCPVPEDSLRSNAA